MRTEEKNGNLHLYGVPDFCIEHIFECGQCFRWDRLDNSSYIGVAYGKALKISQKNNNVVLYDTSEEDYKTIWESYFDLDRDYSAIKNKLSEDEFLKEAVNYGTGIRILKQDLWECTISFIISASNNIPRIKKIISLFCENFGESFTYMGKTYYSFPETEKIAGINLSDLSVIKAGFRDKYILDAAQKIASGEINTISLKNLPAFEAKKKLMTINGVGEKVADCIMLYGLGRFEYFPVDVWMKRVMEFYYFKQEQKISVIRDFSCKKFGTLSGFAQQYLFFYGRDNKIGVI